MKPLETQRILTDEQRLANLELVNELKRGFNRKSINKKVLDEMLSKCYFIVSHQKDLSFYVFTSEYDFLNSKNAIETRFDTEFNNLRVMSVEEIINEYAKQGDTLLLSLNRFILNHLITISHALKKSTVYDYSVIIDPLAFE